GHPGSAPRWEAAGLTRQGEPVLVAPWNGPGDASGPPTWERREGGIGLQVWDWPAKGPRWCRALSRAPERPAGGLPNRYLVGPDLNGDGRPDVFTAALLAGSPLGRPRDSLVLLLAAHSGADGKLLRRSWQPVQGGHRRTADEWAGAFKVPLGELH